MYKFESWTWCRCWLPLLGIGGGVGVHVGGLDVVPLLAAIAGCHCWAAIAIAGLPLLGIGGCFLLLSVQHGGEYISTMFGCV